MVQQKGPCSKVRMAQLPAGTRNSRQQAGTCFLFARITGVALVRWMFSPWMLVVLLPFCSLVDETAAGSSDREQPQCPSASSRKVRGVLDKEFYPILEYEGVKLSIECPLHKQNDCLSSLESQKMKKRRNRWKCKTCGKTFKQEEFLDQHLQLKHPELMEEAVRGNVCLADWCGVLAPCDDSSVVSVCSPQHMERQRYKCQALMEQCFPAGGGRSVAQMHDLFTRKFCNTLTCNEIAKKDRVLEFHATQWSQWRIFWYVLGALGVFVLGMFYFTYWLYKSEFTTKSDLRRRRRGMRLSLWRKAKEG